MPVPPATPWLDRVLGDAIGPVLVWLGRRAKRRGDRHEFNHILSAVLHGNSDRCTPDRCTLQEHSMDTLLTHDDLTKLGELTRLLDEAYTHYFETSDGYAKLGEGTLTIRFGSFEDRTGGAPRAGIDIFSSVFGTGRQHRFTTIEEALVEVSRWHAAEMADTHPDPFAVGDSQLVDPDCPHGPDEPCTCDGCWCCEGHVVGCTCDINWDAIAERRLGL